MKNNKPIIIRPVISESQREYGEPEIGDEMNNFMENKVPEESREDLLNDTISILSKSMILDTEIKQETGLILGHIQSGKTMSIEAVMALARDNGFPMVILIGGISTPLLKQTVNRLKKDLGTRNWAHLLNPDKKSTEKIKRVFDEWRINADPMYRPTILISVLKNHQRIQSLIELLKIVNMEKIPVLVIDDEADQASLNTRVKKEDESTTFSRLKNLRETLPNHTYLQYTATPQAPLLISIINSLSPNFVQVLKPGKEYVGGQDFFKDSNKYVRIIPPTEVPTKDEPLDEAPSSLLEALRIFMIGMTIGFRTSKDTENRSMLIHPSRKTEFHQKFYNWVQTIVDDWKTIFREPDEDFDRQKLIEDFKESYKDLAGTATDIMPFEECMQYLSHTLSQVEIKEVNRRTNKPPAIDWKESYGWILIGGQMMDRGFTVEGLTVTYMPRGVGIGNVDTIQQRARFFGYKKKYLGYCRVYLEQSLKDAFQNYVEHERELHEQLKSVEEKGQSLNDWKRKFILDPDLRPCRAQVLEFDYDRISLSGWTTSEINLLSDEMTQHNREVVSKFMQELDFSPDAGHHKRKEAQKHKVCMNVPLEKVLKEFLVPMRFAGNEHSQKFTVSLLYLNEILERSKNEKCTIYQMSPGYDRKRSIENGKVKQLFQGAYPDKSGEIYPGDKDIRDNDSITIQIHILDLQQNGEVTKKGVPVIAVWIPKRHTSNWIIQDQPDQV